MPSRPSISLIIPAYNEHQGIQSAVVKSLETLAASGHPFEVVIVDDGSTDGTRQIIEREFGGVPNVKMVSKPNGGVGSALRAGIAVCAMDYVTFVPVDNPLTASVLEAFTARIGQADILVGYRRRRVGYTPRMQFNSMLYEKLISGVFGLRLRDYNWIHMYPRQIFALGGVRTVSHGIFAWAEMLIRCHWHGLTFREFPVEMQRRNYGVKTAATFKAGWRTMKELAKFWWREVAAPKLHGPGGAPGAPVRIKFVDLGRQYERYQSEIHAAIDDVLRRGDFILGDAVLEFEKAFAAYCGTRYAVGVDSGTSALILAVEALGLTHGDEAITVPNTYISTAYAVSEAGASPVFVDVDEPTQLLDVAKLEAAITPRTKAILPVHLFGQMADMEAVMRLAKQRGLQVIEDACQAHGASRDGRKAGAWGDLGCFSFYPGKNLGAYGDGGMITTNSETLYRKLLLLRNYGSPVKYRHEIKGKNARLDTLQAAVLRVKLKHLDEWNERRQEIAALYLNGLAGVGDLRCLQYPPQSRSCHHLFVVRTSQREALSGHLNALGIPVLIHYPIAIHLQPAYAELGLRRGAFPVAEQLADEILSLPIHPDLRDDEAHFVVDSIRRFFARRRRNVKVRGRAWSPSEVAAGVPIVEGDG